MTGDESFKLWLGRDVLVEVVSSDIYLYIIQPPRCLQAFISCEVFLQQLYLIMKAIHVHISERANFLKEVVEKEEVPSYRDKERAKILEQMAKTLGDMLLDLNNLSVLAYKFKKLSKMR